VTFLSELGFLGLGGLKDLEEGVGFHSEVGKKRYRILNPEWVACL